ncbi:MAG: flavodoxin-dependent (E)-4-hydroxy-3-methylbut-2-enyl-diphosphate synthase, partial [Solirubrobacteraceae bacterium]
FDMDSVVTEVEQRLQAYPDPIEVSILGCAVNGIGEARHADFGITGAKDAGMIFSKGEPLKKVPTDRLVEELFAEIDRYYESDKTVVRDAAAAEEARQWLAENEDLSAMTPERLAAIELEKNKASGGGEDLFDKLVVTGGAKVDEASSPTAGRRFNR